MGMRLAEFIKYVWPLLLFRYFLRSGIWRTFAENYMSPEQVDGVGVTVLEVLLLPVSA
ncbi:hypothetical protein LRS11_14380 [Pseudomonas sp. J452]|uniref:hypothetical protein n=1 Tax=Pseudomonas sp. J452 TaxID=2898441 RepID=UPI0021ADF331|nr:hypothetical protein [Pseudomonas sp. J452]UUY07019.1 hypothetical protein LRS11_14380 [Pseudomonas sp. J452]